MASNHAEVPIPCAAVAEPIRQNSWMGQVLGDFDAAALFAVVDEQLAAREMTLSQLARELAWMSKDTLSAMPARGGAAGCHHILPVVQWVGRTPESFTVGAESFEGELLPEPGEGGWRWYWHMTDLACALDAQRIERGMSWSLVADELGTTPAEIKAFQKTRYGTTISFAMRVARWLDRTANSFMWEHDGRGLPWSGRRV